MSRPACALLDAHALQHNFKRVKELAPHSKVMAVIKADAYGHGMLWAAGILSQADGYAVASVEEGAQLRKAVGAAPICLLSGFFEGSELPQVAALRLSPVLHEAWQVDSLLTAAPERRMDAWIKLDTGMHRIGFDPDQLPGLIARLQAGSTVGRLGVMSHFANADDPDDPLTVHQIEQFTRVTAGCGLERSLANSAGVCAWPASRLEWVRPGIMLYGASPLLSTSASALGLQPVMTLVSRLVAIQQRRRGDPVGYGGDWVCPEDMPVGVVAIGYGDGYPRHAPAGTPVLVRGRRATLIGRVSMDMLTVDLRGLPAAAIGDPVVLWGEGLPIDEIAAAAGTIPYELMCNVAPRVPRHYATYEEVHLWQR